jgi:hypothetical protein
LWGWTVVNTHKDGGIIDREKLFHLGAGEKTTRQLFDEITQ